MTGSANYWIKTFRKDSCLLDKCNLQHNIAWVFHCWHNQGLYEIHLPQNCVNAYCDTDLLPLLLCDYDYYYMQCSSPNLSHLSKGWICASVSWTDSEDAAATDVNHIVKLEKSNPSRDGNNASLNCNGREISNWPGTYLFKISKTSSQECKFQGQRWDIPLQTNASLSLFR